MIKNSPLNPSTLSSLVEASSAINASLDIEPTLQAIARTAASVMGAEASSVLILDPKRDRLTFCAATGDHAQALIGQEFDANVGIAGKVLHSGKPLLVSDVSNESSFYKGIDEKVNFTTRGMVAAPLIKNGQVIGVVEVINKVGETGFGPDDLELIQLFANLAASGTTNAQAHERLKRENQGFRSGQEDRLHIVGQSQALRDALALCARVARTNATVLLLGETGTGKEVLSRHIHANCERTAKPFIAINCAALPETLLESELFGHEKGAFTGATSQKVGRFELADGGTLFLDEIGDISHSTQLRLLRVLQEREFVRVGGTKTVSCDVRVIAATNRDLQAAIKEKKFREDLYYRLNVFPIRTPPLRERRDDIPLLVDHFITSSAARLGVETPVITEEAVVLLVRYEWPGNIRELQNVIERAVLLADHGRIEPGQLPREVCGESADEAPAAGDNTLWGYEKAMIVRALKENGWNQTRAAKALGISRDNLRYRVKKFEIQRPESA